MRRHLRILGLLILLGVLSLYVFYQHYQRLADTLIYGQHLRDDKANAVKHAYAAGQLYIGLTSLYVPNDMAENMVAFLGTANERMEQVIDNWDHPDSTTEMMRDLYNNQVGLTATQWRQQGHDVTLLELMVWLSAHNVLLPDDISTSIPASAKQAPKPRDADFAITWFAHERAAIAAATKAALKQYQPTKK